MLQPMVQWQQDSHQEIFMIIFPWSAMRAFVNLRVGQQYDKFKEENK
jgi:hypothetical protein